MAETLTFKGKLLTLAGRRLKTGMAAPDFRVVSAGLTQVSLADLSGAVKIISSFPSLDTPVCDAQVKEFNKRAAGLSGEVAIYGVSKDLPFAQTRFCDSFDIKNVKIFSDYKYSSYGINYGLLIKELSLLARSVIILDKNNIVRYLQIVPELTNAPDYEDVLNNLGDVLNNPSVGQGILSVSSKCIPCKIGTPPLPAGKISELILSCPGWQLEEGKRIIREFKFKDFIEAKYFLDLIAEIAEEQGHHPDITLQFNRLKLAFTTHAAKGLTENDFIMARIINELGA